MRNIISTEQKRKNNKNDSLTRFYLYYEDTETPFDRWLHSLKRVSRKLLY